MWYKGMEGVDQHDNAVKLVSASKDGLPKMLIEELGAIVDREQR